jgi:flagellar biosynthetic protein FlhB
VLLLVALGSPLLIGGWLFSAKALQPNFGRMNPIAGLGNMISARAGVELLKAIVKTIWLAALPGLSSWGKKRRFLVCLWKICMPGWHT